MKQNQCFEENLLPNKNFKSKKIKVKLLQWPIVYGVLINRNNAFSGRLKTFTLANNITQHIDI